MRFSAPAGSVNVELDDSNCVVIRQPRLRSVDDVVVTVTDVERLRDALRAAHELQGLVDAGAVEPPSWPRSGVERVQPGRWMVPSKETQPGAYWKVDEGSRPRTGRFWTCTCPAGVARGAMGPASSGLARLCRHVRAVIAAEEVSTAAPRPTAKPDPSAIVD